MDSEDLRDDEGERSNGELDVVTPDSPVIQSAPSGFNNGKGLDESPSSAVSKSENQGKPLRKWRRIRRDFTKSVSPDFNKEGSAGSGREVTDLADLVQLHKRRIPLPDCSRNGPSGDDRDRADDVEGENSVASVESNSTGLIAASNFVPPPVVPLDPEVQLMVNTPIFAIGAVDSENSEDRSSMSSTAASVPKSRRENLGFGRERGWSKGSSGFMTSQRAPRVRGKSHLKIDGENSNSNSNAVSNGKHSDKSVNYYGGENSDEGLQGEEVRSAYFRENGELENSNPVDLDSNFEEGKNSGFENPDLDPLVESVVLLQTTQETLETAFEKWVETGKEVMEEESEEIQETEWNESPDLKFEIQEQNEKINNLNSKLKEASKTLVEKDSILFELESFQTLIQPELDQLIREKFEAEIEYLVIYKTFLKWNQTLVDSKAFAEAKEQNSLMTEHRKQTIKLREIEKREAVLGKLSEKFEMELKEKSDKLEILEVRNKVFNASWVYLIELVLVGLMLVKFIMIILPEPSDVVPT